MMSNSATVDLAVIGAGMAGLSCARAASALGLSVRVFDKARGPGGRTSTRRLSAEIGLDHGAQFLELDHPDVEALTAPFREDGTLVPWTPVGGAALGTNLWTGTPGMNALAKAMAAPLAVSCPVRITQLERSTKGWRLLDESGKMQTEAARVAVAIPAPQAAELLTDAAPELAHQAKAVPMQPVFAALIQTEGSDPLDSPDVWLPEDGPLSLAVAIHRKPGRGPHRRFCLHATRDWSDIHVNSDPEFIVKEMVKAAVEIGVPLSDEASGTSHRWLYARAAKPLGVPYLLSDDGPLGLCGDWVFADGIGAAMRSGHALGLRLAKS